MRRTRLHRSRLHRLEISHGKFGPEILSAYGTPTIIRLLLIHSFFPSHPQLSDPDDPDEILKQVRKWKIKHTEHGHPIMDDDAAATTAADGSSSDAAAAAASSEDSQKAKDAKERSFLDYTDDDDDDDEDDFDNSDGDDSEEERELLRRVEEKFFRDRRQAPVEATMG